MLAFCAHSSFYLSARPAPRFAEFWKTPYPDYGWVGFWSDKVYVTPISWVCREYGGWARWADPGNNVLSLDRSTEMFPRIHIVRHTGAKHPYWRAGQSRYTWGASPGFVRISGDSVRSVYRDSFSTDFTGSPPVFQCMGIPLLDHPSRNSHSCKMVAFNSDSTSNTIPKTGPAAWELRGSAIQFQYRTLQSWPVSAMEEGYRVGILAAVYLTTTIDGVSLSWTLDSNLTKYDLGFVAMNSTFRWNGNDYPLHFYLQLKFPQDDPTENLQGTGVPMLRPNNLTAAWVGADSALQGQSLSRAKPDFVFGNMQATANFDAEISWRGGDRTENGEEGLHTFIAALLGTSRYNGPESNFGTSVADTMDLGVEIGRAHV